ncbi:helix-turn-helix domain-containing protein [Streptomyces violaceusniger]
MSRDAHLSELGEFLKARRAELSPRAMGLPESGALRRVPGLRREEVAQLTAISTVYYTRLEQGRTEASTPVLIALTRALRLDEDQRDYMLELAGKENVRPRRHAAQKVRPPLRRLLDSLTDTPALVLGRRMDILAWNPLAAALMMDFSQIPEEQRNAVRLVFADPTFRELYVDWESAARTTVAFLRMEAADNPDDPRMTALVEDLSEQDPQFREWWAAHHVAHHAMGTKTFRHPVAGDLTLDWETLACPTDPDQQLVILTAMPGSPSHEGLRFLASWAATHQPTDAVG